MVKNKKVTKVENNTTYLSCVFYLEKLKDIENCVFDNCSFRTPMDVENIQHCKFINCNFVSLSSKDWKTSTFQGCTPESPTPYGTYWVKADDGFKVLKHLETGLEFVKVPEMLFSSIYPYYAGEITHTRREFYISRYLVSYNLFLSMVPLCYKVYLENQQGSYPYIKASNADIDLFKSNFKIRYGLFLKRPTYAQWVIAAFGDSQTKYPWGSKFDKNYAHIRKKLLPKNGEKKPNQFGIYDMIGLYEQYIAFYDLHHTNVTMGHNYNDKTLQVSYLQRTYFNTTGAAFRPVLEL